MEAAGAVNILYGTAASGLQADDPDDQRWTQAGDEIEGDPESDERFGAALAAGDFSGDGFADLAIGVPNADFDPNIDAGEVNVIYGSSAGSHPLGISSGINAGPWSKETQARTSISVGPWRSVTSTPTDSTIWPLASRGTSCST